MLTQIIKEHQDQIVTFSDDEDEEEPIKKEGRIKHFLKKRKLKKKLKKVLYTVISYSDHLQDAAETPATQNNYGLRRRSSVFTHLIEEESLARKSSLRSISSFTMTGKITNEDDPELNGIIDAYVDIFTNTNKHFQTE